MTQDHSPDDSLEPYLAMMEREFPTPQSATRSPNDIQLPERRLRRLERTGVAILLVGLLTLGVALAGHKDVARDHREHEQFDDFEARRHMIEDVDDEGKGITAPRVLGDILRDIDLMKRRLAVTSDARERSVLENSLKTIGEESKVD